MGNEKSKKPKALTGATPSYGWMERDDYKKENRDWLRSSRRVALRVLDALESKKMSQQDLANILGVTRQQVSKIVKGQENFTFATAVKLQQALGIDLKDIFEENATFVKENHVITSIEIYLVKRLDEILNKSKPIHASQSAIAKFKQQYDVEYQKEFLAGTSESNYAMAG
jgi:transcriptional regulator with XRE-family HTH domain